MKCDKQLLEQYVDDFLPLAEKQQIEKHLVVCKNCQKTLEQLQREQLELIGMLNRPTLHKSLADDIMQQLEQPVVKKRRWQLPLTVAATAMLAVGLLYLNKDELLTNSGIEQTVETKAQIIIDEVTVEAGVVNVWLQVKDKNGDNLTPAQPARVKVLKDNKIDISESQTILVNKTEGRYHYVIQLEQLSYNHLTFEFIYEDLNVSQSVTVDASNILETVEFDDIQLHYQGKRLINNKYELFYRLGYKPSVQAEFEQLHQQFIEQYGNIGQNDFYKANVTYSLVDKNGRALIGERFDSSWEGAGISSTGSSIDKFGTIAWALTLPKQYGVFPLTMQIEAIEKTIPVLEEIHVNRSEVTTFKIGDETYKIVSITEQNGEHVIRIEGAANPSEVLDSFYLYIDGQLHYVTTSSSNGEDHYVYELTTMDKLQLPEQFEIIITSISQTSSIEPVEITLQ